LFLEGEGVRGSSDGRAMNVTLIDYTDDFHIVACTAVAMHRRRIFKAVSGQRLGTHVLVGTDMIATIEDLCFLGGPCRDVVNKDQSQLENSVLQAVKIGPKHVKM
jgi:hypothetical protein